MASQAKNVGILAIEIYFPPTCIQQVRYLVLSINLCTTHKILNEILFFIYFSLWVLEMF